MTSIHTGQCSLVMKSFIPLGYAVYVHAYLDILSLLMPNIKFLMMWLLFSDIREMKGLDVLFIL